MAAVCHSKSSNELNGQCDKSAPQRSKCWPPSYCDPPPLIITDYSVCRASTPTSHHAAAASAVIADDPERANTAVDDPVDADVEAGDRPLCDRTSPVVVVTVTAAVDDDDDDVDDSQRLLDLSRVEQQVDAVPGTDSTAPLSDD